MTESTKNKLFCFGYGFSCDYLGLALSSDENWKIAGTTRDPNKRRALQKMGIKAFLFDYDAPLQDPDLFLNNVTHILISTPPGEEGDPTFLMHSDDIARMASLKWLGYLSSTSVYGDRDGDWVDEMSELRPTSKRGSRRMIAEDQWMSLHHSHGLPVHIFRLAGIYGPGRSALDTVRAGIARRVEKKGHMFSRIHVEDIVNVLLASMHNPQPGEIYNICDDMPVPSHDVIAYACELLNVPPPPLVPFDATDLPPIAKSFYSDNKRVRNDKIKSQLGVSLHYKNYQDGLRGCLDAEKIAKHSFDGVCGS